MYIIISEPDGRVLLTQQLEADEQTTLGELDQALNRSYVRLHADRQNSAFLGFVENWQTAPEQMAVYVRRDPPADIVQQVMDWARAAWDELVTDKVEPTATESRPEPVSAVIAGKPRGWDS